MVTKPSVFLYSRKWTKKGHGGFVQVTDYEIYLNKLRVCGFSTHGDMIEGYWGSRAGPAAVEYAKAIAHELGVSVIRVRSKD